MWGPEKHHGTELVSAGPHRPHLPVRGGDRARGSEDQCGDLQASRKLQECEHTPLGTWGSWGPTRRTQREPAEARPHRGGAEASTYASPSSQTCSQAARSMAKQRSLRLPTVTLRVRWAPSRRSHPRSSQVRTMASAS